MNLHNPELPLHPPNVCFICESTPLRKQVVDTQYSYDPGGPTRLNGRKYLCEDCVKGAMQALGYPLPHDVEHYRQGLEELQERVKFLEEENKELATSEGRILKLFEDAMKAWESKPVPKHTRTRKPRDA